MTSKKKAEQLLSSAKSNESGCLNVTCGKHNGYGWVSADGTQMYAHRAVWLGKRGLIPKGLWVLHRCGNRECINPAHLYLGTPRQNNIDCVGHGTWKWGTQTLKLNADKVREIKATYQDGMFNQQAIADKFGVCQGLISQIVRGRKWAHV